MKTSVVIAFLAGVAVTVWLLYRIGLETVFDAALSVGWGGFLLIAVSGLVMEALSGLGYWLLVPGKASWPVFVASRQLRDSVGDILPFTQFAGMLAGVRVVVAGGAQAATAFAGLVVDVTAEFVAQIGFMALGLLLGLTALRSNAVLAPYVNGLILGTVLLLPGAGLFVVLQHKGSALVERISARLLPAAVCHTEAFLQALTRLYGRPLRLALATLLHLLSWIASGIWLWLTVRLTGAHLGLAQAIVIQSLLEAFRSAAVFVPSSIGVQEAGLTALAPVFGLAPEVGLAASLLRRARDVAIGIPVLLIWQMYEGRRALRRTVGQSARLP
jgi:glycosyltransferase 2 family protein